MRRLFRLMRSAGALGVCSPLPLTSWAAGQAGKAHRRGHGHSEARRVARAARLREHRHRARRAARESSDCSVRAKCSKSCRASSSPSTAATVRRTSTSCAASISTTAPTSPRASTALPVNMPTHGHGQGYSDINFLIPELVERIDYKKGTYYADEGNFSAAGAADVTYARHLDQSIAVLGGGQYGYRRAMLALSPELGDSDLVAAVDYQHNDGPWDLEEGFRKINGLLKYTRGDRDNGFGITAMGYDGKWKSTDQIPLRAVQDGDIGRFGFVDPTDGGETHRYSLSADYWTQAGAGKLTALAYAIDYHLDLISNFTYYLDQADGDQFEQFDDRKIYGGNLRYTMPLTLGGFETELASGVDIRHDDISPVGLYRTNQRERLATIREDKVKQTSYSAFISDGIAWTSKFRTTLGLRADSFRLRREQQPADQQRHGERLHREPEAHHDVRPLGWHGAVRQPRRRLPQQ